MRALALDLGTRCGYSICEVPLVPGGTIILGTYDFSQKRYEGNGMRYIRFKEALTEIKPEIVFFEEVRRHRGVTAAHVYGGFLSHLHEFCDRNEIPYEGVPVATIKRQATGKGNANKEQMMEAAKKKGYYIEDDNQADALFIMFWALDNRLKHMEAKK